jgi:4-amino-4-deoxy-L-arabinose transferase-like glycosyltransferase
MTSLGLDTLDAARWLSSALFGLNVFLLGYLIHDATRSAILSILAALLALSSPALIAVHTWVLSDPLFLTLALLTLLALIRVVERGRGRDIAAAGLLAALAFLTRYVGLALVASGALAILSVGGAAVRARLARAAGFAAFAASAPVAWAVRDLVAGGSLTNRAIDFHLPGGSRLLEAAGTVSLWLLPGRVPFGVRVGLAAMVVVVVMAFGLRALLRRGGREVSGRPAVLGWTLLLFVVLYPLSLLASLAFLDASTPLDDRILSPLLVAAIALTVLAAGAALHQAAGRSWLRLGMALAAITFLGLSLYRAGSLIVRLRQDGQGYAARAWADSALIQWVRGLPADTPIYSNELDALYLHTGRQAFQVPIRWDPVREAARDDYDAQLAAMRRRIGDEGAVLVLFNTIVGQSGFLPPAAELTRGLSLVFEAGDGAAYRASATARWTSDSTSFLRSLGRDPLGRMGLE